MTGVVVAAVSPLGRCGAVVLAVLLGMGLPGAGRAQDVDLQGRTMAALSDYQGASARATKLLGAAALELPVPPALPLECPADGSEAQVRRFVDQALQPEGGLIAELRAARAELELLGAEPGTAQALEAKLAARLGQKADRLLREHAGAADARERMRAIAAFTGKAATYMQLAGDTGAEQALLGRLSTWLSGLLPAMLRDLREKHDYALVEAILAVTRTANLTGDTAGADADSIWRQIEAAMRFDLALTFEASVTGANGHVESWTLESAFPVRYRLEGKDVLRPLLAGSGTGTYASYTDPDPVPLRMTAADFEVAATVEDLDPCAGTASVAVDRFFADTETYHTQASSDDEPRMMWAFDILYDDRRDGGRYRFEVPLRNLNAAAVEHAVAAEMNAFAGTFTIRLTHRPE